MYMITSQGLFLIWKCNTLFPMSSDVNDRLSVDGFNANASTHESTIRSAIGCASLARAGCSIIIF